MCKNKDALVEFQSKKTVQDHHNWPSLITNTKMKRYNMKQQWHNSTLILNCTHDHTVARTQEPLYAYSCLHLHSHIVTGPHAFQHTLSPETNRWAQQTCTWAHRASVSVSDSWPQSTQLNKTAWMGVEAFTGLVETTWTGQQSWIKQLHLGLQHIPQHWKRSCTPFLIFNKIRIHSFFTLRKFVVFTFDQREENCARNCLHPLVYPNLNIFTYLSNGQKWQ